MNLDALSAARPATGARMIPLEQKERLLKAIAHAPRELTHFTQGEVHSTVSARHVERWLNEIADEGLIDKGEDGYYSITAQGRRALEPANIAPSRYYGNASTTARYVSEISKVPARGEGAMAAYRIKSLGFGA